MIVLPQWSSSVVLIIALAVLVIHTIRANRAGKSVRDRLTFQLSLVVALWLASELAGLLARTAYPASYFDSSQTATLFYDVIHFFGMLFFAAFMTWRTLRFLR